MIKLGNSNTFINFIIAAAIVIATDPTQVIAGPVVDRVLYRKWAIVPPPVPPIIIIVINTGVIVRVFKKEVIRRLVDIETAGVVIG